MMASLCFKITRRRELRTYAKYDRCDELEILTATTCRGSTSALTAFTYGIH